MKMADCVTRIAGEGGEGVISCGEILTRAMARSGYHVMSWKTFPSEIRGGLARYQFRARSEPVLSMGSTVDVLVAFNQEAMTDCCADHTCSARVVVYDPEYTRTTGCASVPGVRYPIPLTSLCRESTGGLRAKNTVAMGVVARLLGVDRKICEDLIVDMWARKGDEIVQMNHRALAAGYEAAGMEVNPIDQIEIPLPAGGNRRLLMMSGNDAVGLGALAAECRFIAGYPITPATSIFEFLCEQMPRFGGYAVQAEDEMAALAATIGASFGGLKSMTATSGPGLCLMSELINMSSMTETPVVIANVMRGGPSTGLPTKTEQSDLLFSVFGSTGEAPRIVLAPATIEDCYYQTIRAFNLAERYQMPVILLTDASLAFRQSTMPEPNLDRTELVERDWASPEDMNGGYHRYRITPTGVSPMMRPGVPGGEHIVSTLEHLETGKPDYSPAVHEQMMAKRFRKLETAAAQLEAEEAEALAASGARVGVIGWGSTFGALREALDRFAAAGVEIAHFHPRVLWPLPLKALRDFLAPLDRVFVVEENFTEQLAMLIRTRLQVETIPITKCQGSPFTADEIHQAMQERLR